ncbi:MAG: glutamine-hydrolyzing GMP synthase [Verrucomicrobiota bacterium]|nr:glutamine-hydrolyzing GMP synthase [Verrucomicrobiota bacterium]
MQKIIILDFGSQYTQLIARRIRECSVYSEIVSYRITAEELQKMQPTGIILSGGPASVYADNAPLCDEKILEMNIPILGICYGLQLINKTLGGKVEPSSKREYGRAELSLTANDSLFNSIEQPMTAWMSHGDKVLELPEGFNPIAKTNNTEFAAISNPDKNIWGIQFHPEVVHTPEGTQLLQNFCRNICRCTGNWTMKDFVVNKIEEIRKTVGKDSVILGLSGGVDSSVAAALIHKAIGKQLTCVFVNNGVLRMNEAERVQKLFRDNFHIKLEYVEATDRFLNKLKGVTEPEEKRKIIGHEFIEVFDEATKKIENVRFLGQGTTYPDVIESVSINDNPSAMIKSHHNVGGLPKKMKLKLLEPMKNLFKDEVREVGRELGLPKEVVMRQPFPGPGLAIRIISDITREKLEVLRKADKIVMDEMKNADYYYKVWQSFCVLLPVQSVGVMGDERTYENAVALRIVDSQDGMTADWVKLPYELLGRISNRIINEVKGINRVTYDISSKPPGTIEWE